MVWAGAEYIYHFGCRDVDWAGHQGGIRRDNKKFFRDEYVHLFDCGDNLTGVHICQLIELHTLKCAVYYMSVIPQ